MEWEESNKRTRIERFAYKSITQRLDRFYQDQTPPPDENIDRKLKAERRKYLWLSGSLGAVSIIILYLPYYLWPGLFPETKVWVPLLDKFIDIPVTFLLYSFVLVLIELGILMYFNFRAVSSMAGIYGYLDPKDPSYEINVNVLISVGLNKTQKSQTSLGINPYFGLSRFYLVLFVVFNKMKAVLTNVVVKLLVRRLLGRYAFRIVIDLVGIPVYAFWNAWAIHVVMREAKVRILAGPTIQVLVNQLHKEQKENAEFLNELYFILDYMAIVKRKFHYNHFLLSENILNQFEIPVLKDRAYDNGFLNRIKDCSPQTQMGFSKLLLFGMFVDGNLSGKEMLLIHKMNKAGYFHFDLKEAKRFVNDYYKGKGVDRLIYNSPF